MIPVAPLQGRTIMINADLIEAIETGRETVIVFISGRRMVVTDSATDVVERIAHLRASVLAAAEDIVERPAAPVLALAEIHGSAS